MWSDNTQSTLNNTGMIKHCKWLELLLYRISLSVLHYRSSSNVCCVELCKFSSALVEFTIVSATSRFIAAMCSSVFNVWTLLFSYPVATTLQLKFQSNISSLNVWFSGSVALLIFSMLMCILNYIVRIYSDFNETMRMTLETHY